MYILFPGRHHLLTNYQFTYLYSILLRGLKNTNDINGNLIQTDQKIDGIIFAITSANHSNTRRNPISLYLRAMAIEEFSSIFTVPTFIYNINDVGYLEDFASYTIKAIKVKSDNMHDLTSDNTVVLCSTKVLESYQNLGFTILPAELEDKNKYIYKDNLPWEIIDHIGKLQNGNWKNDLFFLEKTHPSSIRLWFTYNIGNKVQTLFNDKMLGDDGDLTETRDYNTYVAEMDNIADLKYSQTSPYILQGRIGDIGCAVGSWIRLACMDDRFRESDFYGVEIARKLFDVCIQRKNNGDFQNPNVFFIRKNAVSGLVFDKGTMNTVYTSSLTHEIESYSGHENLLKFIQNRYDELALGGVWINRDVIGPIFKEDDVYMKLNISDGRNDDFDKEYSEFKNKNEFKDYLDGLSTYAKFFRFRKDFRKGYNETFDYEKININNTKYIKLKIRYASEFMLKKDYTDNWQSEMHEKFCYWDFDQWKNALKEVGFKILPTSYTFTNQWIVENRFKDKVELYTMGKDNNLVKIEYPVTTMILIAEKN